MLEKSTPPVTTPMGGMTMSSTSDLTMVEKAAPMMMPTAMSTTLPRRANSLNSFSIAAPPWISAQLQVTTMPRLNVNAARGVCKPATY